MGISDEAVFPLLPASHIPVLPVLVHTFAAQPSQCLLLSAFPQPFTTCCSERSCSWQRPALSLRSGL